MNDLPHVWNTNLPIKKIMKERYSYLVMNGFSYQEAIQILIDEVL